MLRSSLLAVALLALPASAQTLWTVAADGTGDFTSVQTAVDAAADGDTLLVRAGAYGSMTISGKGLTVVGEGDPSPLLQVALASVPTVRVLNTAPSQAVVIRGFRTLSLGGTENENVEIDNCAGPVLFEDFESATQIGQAAIVRDCASVTFVDSVLHAAPTFASIGGFFFFGFVPYDGVIAVDSNLFLENCSVRGSFGADSYSVVVVDVPPAPSGSGLRLNGTSTVVATGCTFLGGDGGSDALGLCEPGEDGSPGIELTGSTSRAFLRDCSVTGGSGGFGACGNPNGADAPPQELAPGSVSIALDGSARSFRPASPVQDGGLIDLHFAGEPGDLVILHIAQDLVNGLYIEPLELAIHLPLPPASTFLFGTVPGSGELDLSLPVPPLGGSFAPFTGQAVFVAVDGNFVTAPRSTLMVPNPR